MGFLKVFKLLEPRMSADLVHGGPLPPILVQHALQQIATERRNVRIGLEIQRHSNDLFVHLAAVVRPEGILARHTNVQHHSHRPDIRRVARVRDGLHQFRGRVGWASGEIVEEGVGGLSNNAEPKVNQGDVHVSRVVHEHVLEFDVSVDDVVEMAVVDRVDELVEDLEGHLLGEVVIIVDERVEIAPSIVGHEDVDVVVVLAGVLHTDNVSVVELSDQAEFALDQMSHLLGDVFLVNHLDGQLLSGANPPPQTHRRKRSFSHLVVLFNYKILIIDLLQLATRLAGDTSPSGRDLSSSLSSSGWRHRRAGR